MYRYITCTYAYVNTYKYDKSHQSCPTLCEPMARSLPSSSVHGILQARTLEWVAMPSFRGIFLTRGSNCRLMSPALAGRFLTTRATWEAPSLSFFLSYLYKDNHFLLSGKCLHRVTSVFLPSFKQCMFLICDIMFAS